MKRTKDGCVIPFHYVFQGNTASNIAVYALQPTGNFGTRVVAEADAWAHFRVRRLAFRVHPQTSSGNVAVGFVGGVQDTLPGTLAQISELIPSCYHSTSATVPTEWVKIPGSDLAGPFPWYKSIPGGADATEEAPGVICVWASGATDLFSIEYRGVFEFKTAVNTGNSPVALARLMRTVDERRNASALKYKERLLQVLSTPAAVSPLPPPTGPGAGLAFSAGL